MNMRDAQRITIDVYLGFQPLQGEGALRYRKGSPEVFPGQRAFHGDRFLLFFQVFSTTESHLRFPILSLLPGGCKLLDFLPPFPYPILVNKKRIRQPVMQALSLEGLLFFAFLLPREGDQMKSAAAILLQHGQPLLIDELEYGDPEPDQVLVRLFASGICHSQLHQIRDPNSPTPLLLGHEATGVVLQCGQAVTHVQEGDHVIVTCTWVTA
ncbi:MAG: hypothetical protein D6736_17705 [Nitrospinota bacterium]|nr:MAG: hypothetical protein D6736_17705 [Nitrospinota bacterium]